MSDKTKYGMVEEILALAWKDDDMMGQETLFALQDKVARLALVVAKEEHQERALVKRFPWLFSLGVK